VSFTAEVKDELSRIEPKRQCCLKAELAALVRIEGTLHITGPNATVSRSRPRPHRSPARPSSCCTGSTISRPSSPCAAACCTRRTTTSSRFPASPGCRRRSTSSASSTRRWPSPTASSRGSCADCCAVAYLRGAFLGGGFRGRSARGLPLRAHCGDRADRRGPRWLMARFGMQARRCPAAGPVRRLPQGRRADRHVPALVGAHRALLRTEDVRIVKSMRNEVNRLVNAETANQAEDRRGRDLPARGDRTARRRADSKSAAGAARSSPSSGWSTRT
jgi:cell division protein WhiA